jgi:hypothetical protein
VLCSYFELKSSPVGVRYVTLVVWAGVMTMMAVMSMWPVFKKEAKVIINRF